MVSFNNNSHACASSLKVTVAGLLLSFIASPAAAFISAPDIAIPATLPTIPLPDQKSLTGDHQFSLRHIFHHGTYRHPNLHKRLDVPADASVYIASDDQDGNFTINVHAPHEPLPHLTARSNPLSIQRLADRRLETIEDYLAEARWTGEATTLSPSAWRTDEVEGPDVQDKDTVVTLALMSANAYILEKGTEDWENVDGGFNESQGFGWEGDGLRGHVFANEHNSTIVIGLKGTSTAVFDGPETTTNDKINDNLFFSCCCGAGGQYLWRQVCDCYSTTFTCNSTCLTKSLREENRYYRAAIELYSNVTELYPDANVWVVGHSLGGSVSSLLGQTFGLPTVAFEAPGEALAASRLGLPLPPNSVAGFHQTKPMTGVYHFGNTADPVYMGTCNGATSTCTLAGYAMESQCHAGMTCTYDTVGDKGWRVGIGNHRIRAVIKDVLRAYDEVASCEPDTECVDCFNWKFFESNGSDSTTTSRSSPTSTSTSVTRTSTCKTPGWWGCLDETTTTGTTSTSSSTSPTTTTTTCLTPGWFGCKDITTTKATASPSSPITPTPTPTPTTTCDTPGWFGCKDTTTSAPTITAAPTNNLPAPSSSSSSSISTTCTSKEWFGLICIDPSPASNVTASATSTPTKKPSLPIPLPHRKPKCIARNWYGTCKVREGDDDDDGDGSRRRGPGQWKIEI